MKRYLSFGLIEMSLHTLKVWMKHRRRKYYFESERSPNGSEVPIKRLVDKRQRRTYSPGALKSLRGCKTSKKYRKRAASSHFVITAKAHSTKPASNCEPRYRFS